MPESVLFPAKVTITEDVEPSGLPVTHAELEVSEEVKALPLPTGPQGERGPRGVPVATWVRQDPPIANAAARPTGLTDADIGKWWHRLDDNGMDTWTDTGWVHSANCVGVTGPPALSTEVTVSETIADPKIRTSGIKITGPATDLDAKVTVPAGPQGVQGPNGVSTALRTRSDYDDTIGVVEKSMIAWKNRNSVVNRGEGKFRAMPFPNGYGPWTKSGADFAASMIKLESVDSIELATITIPALPFRWRPAVRAFAHISTNAAAPLGYGILMARLNSPQGQILALGGATTGNIAGTWPVWSREFYSERAAFESNAVYPHARLGPSSIACTVEPYAAAEIYLRIERAYAGGSTGTSLAFNRDGNFANPAPYLEVRAVPVSM